MSSQPLEDCVADPNDLREPFQELRFGGHLPHRLHDGHGVKWPEVVIEIGDEWWLIVVNSGLTCD